MPSSWVIEAPSSKHSLDLASVSMLIDAPQAREPVSVMLDVINRMIPVEFMCLVGYGADGPKLLEGHSCHSDESKVPRACFERYHKHFYRLDKMTGMAGRLGQEAGDEGVLALRCIAADIPDRHWREQIYEREGLTDRLSLLYASTPGSAYALNLYRSAPMGIFQSQEIDRILAVSPLLRQIHRRALGTAAATQDRQRRIDDAERSLAVRAPLLSERERQVCARIAQGITADGIAVDLGVAPATVLTLRKRAYLKLGIHCRLELVRLTA